jgi:two-component system nitrate/nitrite response regulator NarL
VGTLGPWLICDEQRLYAESLAAALRRRGAKQVTTTASALCAAPAGTIVLSLRAPLVTHVATVRTTHPGARLVCLTSGDSEVARRALAEGADGVVARDCGLDEVLRLLYPRGNAGPVAQPPAPGHAAVPFYEAHLRFLTFRERETLELLVAAKSTETIAREMQITTTTARGYVQSILEKLCVHSRLEAVAYAARYASVPLDEAWCSW